MGQSKSTTTESLPAWQENFLKGTVLPQAEAVAGQEFQSYGGQFAPSESPYASQAASTYGGIAGMTPQQYQSQVSQNVGGFQQGVIDTTLAQMARQREQQRVGEQANIIGSGAFDSSRRGVYEGERQAQYELGQGNMIANMMNQGYQQALGTTNQQLAMQQQGAAGLMGAAANQQALQAAQMGGQYQDFLRGQEFEPAKLASILGAGQGNFGRTSTETYSPNPFGLITGFLGGM